MISALRRVQQCAPQPHVHNNVKRRSRTDQGIELVGLTSFSHQKTLPKQEWPLFTPMSTLSPDIAKYVQ